MSFLSQAELGPHDKKNPPWHLRPRPAHRNRQSPLTGEPSHQDTRVYCVQTLKTTLQLSSKCSNTSAPVHSLALDCLPGDHRGMWSTREVYGFWLLPVSVLRHLNTSAEGDMDRQIQLTGLIVTITTDPETSPDKDVLHLMSCSILLCWIVTCQLVRISEVSKYWW